MYINTHIYVHECTYMHMCFGTIIVSECTLMCLSVYVYCCILAYMYVCGSVYIHRKSSLYLPLGSVNLVLL